MELSAVDPTHIRAIILGASSFKKSPTLCRAGFARSASDLTAYCLNGKGLKLRKANLLNLFDSELAPGDQLEQISSFLSQRRPESVATNDIILYYVGHGGFVGRSREYFLAISSTREGFEGSSSIRIGDLSSTLMNCARQTRKYLILDSCFAASVFSEFQGSRLVDIVNTKVLESLPPTGTALLCSSGSRQISLSPTDNSHTMFSGALLELLQKGHPRGGAAVSLEEIGRHIADILQDRYPDDWIRPEVHSPDMSEGNVANVPIFPNPGFTGVARRNEIVESKTESDSQNAQLKAIHEDLRRAHDMTIETLGSALFTRCPRFAPSCKRVTAFTIAIARIVGVSDEEIRSIARGAFLRDIGHLATPDAILFNTGLLTADQRRIVQEHCQRGYDILKKMVFLSEPAEIALCHHERHDGAGYPHGLASDKIPLGARIVSVADTFDAIISERPHRGARTIADGRGEITRASGSQFSPDIVNAFLSMPSDLWDRLGKQIDNFLIG